MSTSGIIQQIDEEILRLEQAKRLLGEYEKQVKYGRQLSTKPLGSPKKMEKTPRQAKRRLSAEGRAKISAAQKARWSKKKK